MAESDGCVISSKFDEAVSVVKNDYQDYNAGVTGVYNSSCPNTGTTSIAGCAVSVSDGKIYGTDSSGTATTS